MKNNTVRINGKQYDAHTGLPLSVVSEQEATRSQRQTVTSTSIHHRTQRSKTLRRKSLSTPSSSTKIQVKMNGERTIRHEKSAAISRFAAHPVVAAPVVAETPDIPAQPHAFTDKVAERAAKTQPVSVPAKQIKDDAIRKALNVAKSQEQPRKSYFRSFNVASGGLALLLLAGYLTYISLPAISIRIAAAQSGINASYPGYQPSGYSLAGPIGYADGQVSIAFAANAGPQNYTVNEKETSWDSSALLENYVIPNSSAQYTTHHQGGLTIYTYGSNAAWVNGGILFTIEGDALLSEEQILKIASSL